MDQVVLLKDKDWKQIDGELCFVDNFSPIGDSIVHNGEVVSNNKAQPYASIFIKCTKFPHGAKGFITHKIDFLNLWKAFRESRFDQNREEILMYWSIKHYNKLFAKILSRVMLFLIGATILPKTLVMIRKSGVYERNKNFKLPPEQNAQIVIYGSDPRMCWIPDIMKE